MLTQNRLSKKEIEYNDGTLWFETVATSTKSVICLAAILIPSSYTREAKIILS